jgi:hypothetical protein
MNALNDPAAPDIVQLEAQIRSHVSGRVCCLQVSLRENGLVLRGRAPSFYVKQLAQHAAMKATNLPIRANQIEVV